VRNQKLRLQGGPGVSVVRQRVAHAAPLWFCAASATVELREERPRGGTRTLTFSEAEGSSPAGRLQGAWRVTEAEEGAGGPPRCMLSYEATLLPRPGAVSDRLPPAAARRLLAEGASGAMRGVAAAAERAAAAVAGPAWLEASPLAPPAASAAAAAAAAASGLPAGGAAAVGDEFGPREMWGAAALPRAQWAAPDFLGVGAVPLPAAPEAPEGGAGADAASPETAPEAEALPALREVHLRRLDTETQQRRRAVATIRVAAPVEFAWAALTDWERHGEFVPGVAVAQLLRPERRGRGRPRRTQDEERPAEQLQPGRRSRLRYMVARCSAYVAAHGLLTLDLLEKGPPASSSSSAGDGDEDGEGEAQRREVQFRAVPEPGEPRMRGKWLIYSEDDDEDDADGAASPPAAPSEEDGRVARALRGSLLKLAVEVLAPAVDPAAAGGRDPLGERPVYEGLPVLLTAVARRAEALWAAARAPAAASAQLNAAAAAPARAITLALPMPKLVAATALAADPEALRAQLLALGFGADGVMPSRQQLRQLSAGAGGSAVEAAVVAAGGFAAAAALLGWRLGYKPRKPRGYWDRLENVRREIEAFIAERGLEPGVMPSKGTFAAAGRTDLARLAERWGGTASLADELGLLPARAADTTGVRRWNAHVAATRAATGLSLRNNAEALLELASATYIPSARMPGLAPEEQQQEQDDSADAVVPVAPAFGQATSLWLQDWRRPQARDADSDAEGLPAVPALDGDSA